jgi:hypothetical protein
MVRESNFTNLSAKIDHPRLYLFSEHFTFCAEIDPEFFLEKCPVTQKSAFLESLPIDC